MARTRIINLLAGAALVGVIALAAGCGGSGGGATAATAPSKAPSKATIGVANSGLGMILVDSQGRTLYLFKKDSGMTSACSGECAAAWPPLLAKGKPTVGNGGNVSLVGTITRADGTTQVTYNGHPLYTFVKDENSGETNGEGVTAFGASWFAVSPAGNQISKPSSSGASAPSPAKPATPKPAAPKAPAPKPAPKPVAPQAAPERAAPPAPQPPARETAPKQEAPSSNGIPQNGGGDGDSDNNGGPSDGDGNV